MTHTPLPAPAWALQAILSRRAVEAANLEAYYSLADVAYGAALLATDLAVTGWLEAIQDEAEALAMHTPIKEAP